MSKIFAKFRVKNRRALVRQRFSLQVESEIGAKFFERLRTQLPGGCSTECAKQSLSILGRSQQVGCLDEASQFIGRNQGDILGPSPMNDDCFSLLGCPIEKRLQVSTSFGIRRFDRHGKLYRDSVQLIPDGRKGLLHLSDKLQRCIPTSRSFR